MMSAKDTLLKTQIGWKYKRYIMQTVKENFSGYTNIRQNRP